MLGPNITGVVLSFGALMSLSAVLVAIYLDMQRDGSDFPVWISRQSLETIINIRFLVMTYLAMLGLGVCLSLFHPG